jgi:hypothetical protein
VTANRTASVLLLLGWMLVYSRHGDDWHAVGTFAEQWQCQRALDAYVARETEREIGGALASQTSDVAMRQTAYGRAERHVRERYRCTLGT